MKDCGIRTVCQQAERGEPSSLAITMTRSNGEEMAKRLCFPWLGDCVKQMVPSYAQGRQGGGGTESRIRLVIFSAPELFSQRSFSCLSFAVCLLRQRLVLMILLVEIASCGTDSNIRTYGPGETATPPFELVPWLYIPALGQRGTEEN